MEPVENVVSTNRDILKDFEESLLLKLRDDFQFMTEDMMKKTM
jgi:hypothetical protein